MRKQHEEVSCPHVTTKDDFFLNSVALVMYTEYVCFSGKTQGNSSMVYRYFIKNTIAVI